MFKRRFCLPLFLLCGLLAYAPEVFAYGQSFNNALVDAADRGSEAEVSRLLQAGETVNSKGDFGITPLMRATFRGHRAIAQRLLEAGANPNETDIGGATALHIAARQGYRDITELLLHYGANVNAEDKEQWTPIMRAIALSKPDIVKILMDNGADPSKANALGETAITLATRSPAPQMLAIIQQPIVRTDTIPSPKFSAPETVPPVEKLAATPENIGNTVSTNDPTVALMVETLADPSIKSKPVPKTTPAIEEGFKGIEEVSEEEKKALLPELTKTDPTNTGKEAAITAPKWKSFIPNLFSKKDEPTPPQEKASTVALETPPSIQPTESAPVEQAPIGLIIPDPVPAPKGPVIEILSYAQLVKVDKPYYIAEIGTAASMKGAQKLLQPVMNDPANAEALNDADFQILAADSFKGEQTYRARIGTYKDKPTAYKWCARADKKISGCSVVETELLPPVVVTKLVEGRENGKKVETIAATSPSTSPKAPKEIAKDTVAPISSPFKDVKIFTPAPEPKKGKETATPAPAKKLTSEVADKAKPIEAKPAEIKPKEEKAQKTVDTAVVPVETKPLPTSTAPQAIIPPVITPSLPVAPEKKSNISKATPPPATPVNVPPRKTLVPPVPVTSKVTVYWAHMGTYPNKEEAQRYAQQVQQENADLIGNIPFDISQPNVGDDISAMVRLRFGPFMTRTDTVSVCSTIKIRGVSCLAVQEGGTTVQ